MSDGVRLKTPCFVLAVPDAKVAARWWIDVMGFQRVLENEGWVFVKRDACSIHIGSCPEALPAADLGDHSYFGYIEVDAIDAYHAEIARRGASLLFPPKNQPWGMREMGVRTPGGHRVMFAQAIASA